MRTQNMMRHLAWGVLGLVSQQAYSQATQANNNGGVGSFLGWNANANQILDVNNKANQPIDFYTTDLFRARINPRISYAIGTAASDARHGFMLLSGRDNFTQNVKGPFTRLHLVDDVGANAPIVYAQNIGYRAWMRNGITFTGNSDHAYIGQKYAGDDNTDFVIQWSDNPHSQPWGTDRMKFIFSSAFTGAHTGMGSEYGLEAMRLWPKNEKEVNVGVGDFFAFGGDPTERLHVRDGRVRIQQLPDNPETDLPFKVMVVDASSNPLERGVVKWKNISGFGDCTWQLQANNDVASVYNGSSCPWNYGNFVGVGVQFPKSKLQVEYDGSGPNWGGDVTRSTLRSTSHGGRAVAGEARTPLSTQFASTIFTGVSGAGSNAKYTNGVVGTASISMLNSGTAVDLIGVSGEASAYQNCQRTVGVYGTATGATGGNDWAAWFDGKGFLGVGPWVYSDENLKQGIVDLSLTETVGGLMQLHPKSYSFNTSDYPYLHLPSGPQLGLISQEVESVFPELVQDLIRPAKEDSVGNIVEPELLFKAMNYEGLIPVLIAGFQQQQQMIDQQQATITQMQAQLDQCCAAHQGQDIDPNGGLEQRKAPAENDLQEQRLLIIPNPVADLTTLEYYVPTTGKVSLSVSNSDGKPMGMLREEQAEAGAYSYQWNTTKLAAGTYFCTYMLDGAVVVKRAVKVK